MRHDAAIPGERDESSTRGVGGAADECLICYMSGFGQLAAPSETHSPVGRSVGGSARFASSAYDCLVCAMPTSSHALCYYNYVYLLVLRLYRDSDVSAS